MCCCHTVFGLKTERKEHPTTCHRFTEETIYDINGEYDNAPSSNMAFVFLKMGV